MRGHAREDLARRPRRTCPPRPGLYTRRPRSPCCLLRPRAGARGRRCAHSAGPKPCWTSRPCFASFGWPRRRSRALGSRVVEQRHRRRIRWDWPAVCELGESRVFKPEPFLGLSTQCEAAALLEIRQSCGRTDAQPPIQRAGCSCTASAQIASVLQPPARVRVYADTSVATTRLKLCTRSATTPQRAGPALQPTLLLLGRTRAHSRTASRQTLSPRRLVPRHRCGQPRSPGRPTAPLINHNDRWGQR